MSFLDAFGLFLAFALGVDVAVLTLLIRRGDAKDAAEERTQAQQDQDIADELLGIERELLGHGSFDRNFTAREIV